MRLNRCLPVRLSLLPFAFVVLCIGVTTTVVTLRNAAVALAMVGVFFAEGVDEPKVEHAMSTGGPVIVVPGAWLILAEFFYDVETTFDFFKTLLVGNSMERKSCQE